MASEIGASRDGFDERLSQARDAALLDGEEIVAQEMGDQGQAVVVTKSRILILKAGLTATGTLNGQMTTAYTADEITCIKVRKGPMGAVIQVCTEDNQHASQASPPENIVIFSGEQRVKKCDTLAAIIECTIGKPVERIEPKVERTGTPAKTQEASSQVTTEEPAKPGDNAISKETAESVVENTTEVKPKPRGGRKAKSLAEEMYEEMTGTTQPEPVSEPEPVHMEPQKFEPPTPAPEPVIEATVVDNVEETIPVVEEEPAAVFCEETPVLETKAAEEMITSAYQSIDQQPDNEPEEEHEEVVQTDFRPNPNLPKPTKKKGRGPNKALILLGGLMGLVLVGIAVTAPLRQPVKTPTVEINVDKITRNAGAVRLQLNDVGNYRVQINELLVQSNEESSGLISAARSGNRQAVIAAGKSGASDKAWRKLLSTNVPSGLAGAKESLVLGAFTRKNAVANALSVSPPDAQTTIARLTEADSAIAKGLEMIDKMEKSLSNQLAQSKPATQTKETSVKPK